MDEKKRKEIDNESRHVSKNREPKALVSLGGWAVTESGKIAKTEYFRFLEHNLDEYDMTIFTPEEAMRINQHLQKMSTGASSMVPMYCAGPKCVMASNCPLQKIGKAPLAKQCLIEVQLLREWIMRYFDEFEVDPNNFTEVNYVSELADLMIQEMRLNMILSKPENSNMLMEQVVSIDSEGDPIIQKQISPYIEMKERIHNRRTKIIKLMVGDRQEKYKKEAALKVRLEKDPSSQMAEMRSKLEKLRIELENISSAPLPESEESPKTFSPEDLIDSDD